MKLFALQLFYSFMSLDIGFHLIMKVKKYFEQTLLNNTQIRLQQNNVILHCVLILQTRGKDMIVGSWNCQNKQIKMLLNLSDNNPAVPIDS